MDADTFSHTIIPAIDREALDVFGVRVTVLVDGSSSAGTFSLARLDCPPGAGAPLHYHAERERFYLFAGQLCVTCEGRECLLGAGDSLEVEPHAKHAFRNPSRDQMAIALTLGTPAGHDRFFHAANALLRSGEFTPERAILMCAEHGINLVG